MVEVLKKGRYQNPEIKVDCPHCGARMKYKKSEGREVTDNRDGDAVVFKCPECKEDIWLAASIVAKG